MQGFNSILVVLTEDSASSVAMERALLLARHSGAAVTLVDIIGAEPGSLGVHIAALTGKRAGQIEADVVGYHKDRLATYALRARQEGVEVTEAILQGTPFAEVIRMVLREGHDIVIKGAAREGAETARLDGFDMHLLRKCPCPVWIVSDGEDAVDASLQGSVLAAVGLPLQPLSNTKTVDGLVLDTASYFANLLGTACTPVHAWSLQEETALRQGQFTHVHEGQVDDLLALEEADVSDRFAALLSSHPAIPAEARTLKKGAPAEVLADLTSKPCVQLLVMGAVARIKESGVIMGATAETILNRVRCSVLVIKPEGFRSPITLDVPPH